MNKLLTIETTGNSGEIIINGAGYPRGVFSYKEANGLITLTNFQENWTQTFALSDSTVDGETLTADNATSKLSVLFKTGGSGETLPNNVVSPADILSNPSETTIQVVTANKVLSILFQIDGTMFGAGGRGNAEKLYRMNETAKTWEQIHASSGMWNRPQLLPDGQYIITSVNQSVGILKYDPATKSFLNISSAGIYPYPGIIVGTTVYMFCNNGLGIKKLIADDNYSVVHDTNVTTGSYVFGAMFNSKLYVSGSSLDTKGLWVLDPDSGEFSRVIEFEVPCYELLAFDGKLLVCTDSRDVYSVDTAHIVTAIGVGRDFSTALSYVYAGPRIFELKGGVYTFRKQIINSKMYMTYIRIEKNLSWKVIFKREAAAIRNIVVSTNGFFTGYNVGDSSSFNGAFYTDINSTRNIHNGRIFCMFKDSVGDIYLGSIYTGLSKVNVKNGEIGALQYVSGPSIILAITEANGTLYLQTQVNGTHKIEYKTYVVKKGRYLDMPTAFAQLSESEINTIKTALGL